MSRIASADAQEPQTRIPIQLPSRHVIHAELAMTPEQRMRGLMGRDGLSADQGMLFVFDDENKVTFTMRNMRMALDILFLGEDGTVRAIFASVPPRTASGEVSLVRARGRYVLELPEGASKAYGLAVGDRLQFSLPQ